MKRTILLLVSISCISFYSKVATPLPESEMESRSPENELVPFLDLLHEYRLNAPWVTQELMELPVEEFEGAWQEVVDILTKTERQWFYFCDKEQDFDSDQYRHKCLWQCHYYDSWLNRVCIDLAQAELVYKTNQSNSKNIIPIFDYWQIMNQLGSESGMVAYQQFYAFYIDCLSYIFCQAVDYAYQSRSALNAYCACLATSKVCLEKISKLMNHIKASKFYATYHLTLKRYHEVVSLLEEEYVLQG
jgi:hypothetical protein